MPETQNQNQSSDLDDAFDDDREPDEDFDEEPDSDQDPVDPDNPGPDPDDEQDEDRDQDEDDDDQEDEDEEEEDEEEEEGHGKDEDDRPGKPDYVREDWEGGAAPDDSAVHEYQRLDTQALFLSGTPCPHATCENRDTEAEAAWIKLVSAIPVAGQVAGLSVVTVGTAAPDQGQIQTLVEQVRPDGADRYALREISGYWQQFKDGFDTDPETGIAPTLRAGLRTLSEHWKGDDFDAFAEQVEVVMANCLAVCDDIGDASTGAVGLLEQKADEFYGLQGGDSGELPYPAPQYWISDMTQMYTDPFMHVRPPFATGMCQVTAGCEHEGGLLGEMMELGGFNKDYVDEVSTYVENQTQYYLDKFKNEKPPPTYEQAQQWAQADADTQIASDVDTGVEDYESRSRIANEDVINRWENAEESAGTFQPEARPSNPSTFREASDAFAGEYGGLDAGSGGVQPGDPPPDPSGGGGGGGGLEPPGGVSGGLASGGATLGSGGSFPVGPSTSTLEGGGSGSGSGSGSGGRGMGGMMGGGMGGGRGGMNDGQQAEGEHRDWLEEDEEIWGIRAIDDDPYA